MAKKSKKKSFVPVFEDYFDQINILSFEQAGRLFALIRCYSSMDPITFQSYEAALHLESGTSMLWSFLKSDLHDWYERKKEISEQNSRNSKSRWKSEREKTAAPADEIPGQKNLVFTAEPSADGEPVLTAHAGGMRKDATASEIDANALKNDADASPIYNNIHNNTIHNNICDSDDFTAPELDTVIQLFKDNHSTEKEAHKYYDHYQRRNWYTNKGERIIDIKSSVTSWIARNIRFWSNKKSSAAMKQHFSKPAAQYDQNHTSSIHTPDSSGSYCSEGTSRPTGVRENSFCDFEQRTYDYDALMTQIYGCRAV